MEASLTATSTSLSPGPSRAICSIAVAATCRDIKFGFAIRVHNTATRKRIGSIIGVCPGQASQARGLFYALKHLALHVKDKVPAAVFHHGVWRTWQPYLAYETFPDLYKGLEYEDFDQVQPLLFARQKLKVNDHSKAGQADG